MIELHQTQYPGTENKPKRAVFIGLDFGTAYTKVAIAGSSDSFAIKLRPQLSGIDAYLQPGVLTIDEKGIYQIPSGNFNDSYLDNLKLAMDDPQEEEIGIANLSHRSFYHWIYFPKAYSRIRDNSLLINDLEGKEFKRWEKSYKYLVRQAVINTGGTRFLSKNPPNTFRVGGKFHQLHHQ